MTWIYLAIVGGTTLTWCAVWIYLAAVGGTTLGFLTAALLHAGHDDGDDDAHR